MTQSQQAERLEHLTFAAADDATALAHLCGPLDENIRQMETILNVSIARRGAQFRVAGDVRSARRAVRALEVLLDRVNRSGKELSVDDVQWHFIGGDDEYRAQKAESGEGAAGDVALKTRRDRKSVV